MASLPPASQLNDAASLSAATRILFEPSLPLETHLIPALSSCSLPFDSYSQLISACERQVNTWDSDTQAHFIAAHPRIGEVSNLSALSQKEQASQATPPEVLEQLESLNQEYERLFPGLRFITFVAGRSRAQVAHDLSQFLEQQQGRRSAQGSVKWIAELQRALSDIWAIARHRVGQMGLE